MWLLWMGVASAQAPPEDPKANVLIAVFDRVPDDKARRKAINIAFRKAPTLHGGKDWGRALCFHFVGDADPEAIEWALAKAHLEGEVRPGETCDRPPKEALTPAKPEASVLVRFHTEHTAPEIRAEFASLLHMKLDVLTVKFGTPATDRACLEFAIDPDLDALTFALGALDLDISETTPVEACIPALR